MESNEVRSRKCWTWWANAQCINQWNQFHWLNLCCADVRGRLSQCTILQSYGVLWWRLAPRSKALVKRHLTMRIALFFFPRISPETAVEICAVHQNEGKCIKRVAWFLVFILCTIGVELWPSYDNQLLADRKHARFSDICHTKCWKPSKWSSWSLKQKTDKIMVMRCKNS